VTLMDAHLKNDAMQQFWLAPLLPLPKRVRFCSKKCWPVIPWVTHLPRPCVIHHLRKACVPVSCVGWCVYTFQALCGVNIFQRHSSRRNAKCLQDAAHPILWLQGFLCFRASQSYASSPSYPMPA
jgi:hypothetical protein